jgi:hypothetical protein
VTAAYQWHRIGFSKDEVASGAMSRFVVDGVLPAAVQARAMDLNTVAIFESDDSEGGKSLFLSPGAFFTFLTLALAHRAQPCDPPAPEGLSLLYGEEWVAHKLLR